MCIHSERLQHLAPGQHTRATSSGERPNMNIFCNTLKILLHSINNYSSTNTNTRHVTHYTSKHPQRCLSAISELKHNLKGTHDELD
ncbi:hypothetical protein E2C01_033450 [Portunus trituberculatus]|uniref:Uncharacterized protein n=1 Tax=Portunus trituberculatus TaxID=210409 RepID=A0A5B7F436_PORTR|nr:hypothetical protein [Portunus trituberculatus]